MHGRYRAKSPSSAGKAAMDGVACNGWRFWRIEGTEKPKREPKEKADRPLKAKKEPAAKKPVKTKSAKKGDKTKSAKKPEAHRAASQSDPSFGCGVCPETFPTMKQATAHAMTHTS